MLNYKGEVVYLINMKDISTLITTSQLFQTININMEQVRLFDTAVISGIHRTILEDLDEDEKNNIQCQI